MRAVLDTSVLVGGDLPPIDGEVAISTVSLAELHFGLLLTESHQVRVERLRRLALVERSFEPLPVDAEVSRQYGVLAAATVRAGRRARSRAMDLLIAATAAVHHASLYTRNASDLAGLDDLVDIVALP